MSGFACSFKIRPTTNPLMLRPGLTHRALAQNSDLQAVVWAHKLHPCLEGEDHSPEGTEGEYDPNPHSHDSLSSACRHRSFHTPCQN